MLRSYVLCAVCCARSSSRQVLLGSCGSCLGCVRLCEALCSCNYGVLTSVIGIVVPFFLSPSSLKAIFAANHSGIRDMLFENITIWGSSRGVGFQQRRSKRNDGHGGAWQCSTLYSVQCSVQGVRRACVCVCVLCCVVGGYTRALLLSHVLTRGTILVLCPPSPSFLLLLSPTSSYFILLTSSFS